MSDRGGHALVGYYNMKHFESLYNININHISNNAISTILDCSWICSIIISSYYSCKWNIVKYFIGLH